jgi:7-cyano-7-deazaguanine synthase
MIIEADPIQPDKEEEEKEEQPKDVLAVCLVSGGLDSCIAAAVASLDCQLALLHVNYGQRTEKRELKAFSDIAEYYKVPPERRLVADLGHLKNIGGSSLTDKNMQLPPAALDKDAIPSSYVPFRNANLLCIAVSWAEVLGARRIYIGAMEDDATGYPDCSRIFFDAFEDTVERGTRPETKIEIVTPLITLKKHEVIRVGVELIAPLNLTWSCYRHEEVACGRCDSCAYRLRGFQQAGVNDPIPYEQNPELPE